MANKKRKRKKTADDCDPAMLRVRELFAESNLTMEQLAERMGYTGETARQSVWQFLNRTKDPHLSMLRKFARALAVGIREVIAG